MLRTLDEVWALVESLNEDAHEDAWESWIAADEAEESDDEDVYSTAEELREEASNLQAECFRDHFYSLDEKVRKDIEYWLGEDKDLKEQFDVWYGS